MAFSAKRKLAEATDPVSSSEDSGATGPEALLGHGWTKGSKAVKSELDDASARQLLMAEYGRESAPDDERASTAYSALDGGDRKVLGEMYKILKRKQKVDKRTVGFSPGSKCLLIYVLVVLVETM